MTLSKLARNTLVDALTGLCNGGTIELSTDATFGEVLAVFQLKSPAFGASTAGAAIANPIDSTTAKAGGKAAAWRVLTKDKVLIWSDSGDRAVSGLGGEGAIKLAQSSTQLVQGQSVEVSSFTVSISA